MSTSIFSLNTDSYRLNRMFYYLLFIFLTYIGSLLLPWASSVEGLNVNLTYLNNIVFGVFLHVGQLFLYVIFMIFTILAIINFDKKEENLSFYLVLLIVAQIIQFAALVLGLLELLVTTDVVNKRIVGLEYGPMSSGYYIWALGYFISLLMFYYNSQIYEDLKFIKFSKKNSESKSSTN